MPLDTAADVETPEHVRFRYRTAGPVRRGLAYLVDGCIRLGIVLVVALVANAGGGDAAGSVESAGTGAVLLTLFALEWGYYVIAETIGGGRTPGKAALRLRVVKAGGHPVGFLDVALRNLLRAADFLPLAYGVGLLVMAADRRFRRLGDLVAGTMVVVEEAARIAAPIAILPPPTDDELSLLPARPALTAEEREALELFLRRRGRLSEARERELAGLIAPRLRERFGLPAGVLPDPARLLEVLHHRVTRAQS